MTLIICVVIGIIISIIKIKNSYLSDLSDYLVGCCAGAVLGFICGYLISLALPMKTYIKKKSIDIVTLQDNNNPNGKFFLGCGNIKDGMKYSFYYEPSNGVYKLDQVDASLAIIKFSSNGLAKLHISEVTKTEDWINLFAYDSNLGDKAYVFEVPQGTIKNNYNLDAQ